MKYTCSFFSPYCVRSRLLLHGQRRFLLIREHDEVFRPKNVERSGIVRTKFSAPPSPSLIRIFYVLILSIKRCLWQLKTMLDIRTYFDRCLLANIVALGVDVAFDDVARIKSLSSLLTGSDEQLFLVCLKTKLK